MSMAQVLITGVRGEGRTISEVARDCGVSRRWVQTLVHRFDTEGEAAFWPRSRRPQHSPHAVPVAVENQVIRLRKRLTEQGLDAGAETIHAHLLRRSARSAALTSPPPGDRDRVPSVATIWRILVRRGFVTRQPQKRPRSSWIRFEATLPNERWQADITHWQLVDHTTVEVLNIEDDHSRLDVASTACTTFTESAVVTAFKQAFRRHGIPARVLTDNAAVFTGQPRRGGRVSLEIELGSRRIGFDHSRPYHPQTCGKVERFHQTQKKWLAKQPPATTIADLQRQLDRFRRYYNTRRPHRSLGRNTPAEAYAARSKARPTGPKIDPHWRVRHDVVDTGGTITLRHASRLHHIGLGRRWAGTHLRVLVRDRHIRVITRDGELIRDLTLDPTRDYQPRGTGSAVPKQRRKENDVPRQV